MKRATVFVLLLFAPPVVAGLTQFCGTAEDNSSAAEVKPDAATARVLQRIKIEPSFTVNSASEDMKGMSREALDPVIGHLRWVIAQGGDDKLTAYFLLKESGAGRRADVADQFLEGLKDADQSVGATSAMGLEVAPSGKRKEAGLVLIHYLSTQYGTRNEEYRVFHAALNAVATLASPELLDGADELKVLLKAERPMDAPVGQYEEWKLQTAMAIVGILGPQEAIRFFEGLDLSKPAERIATAGAVDALVVFGQERFGQMEPRPRDQLRDVLRDYGVNLLSKDDTREKAERDTSVREAVLRLFATVLGKKRQWRPADVRVIAESLEMAALVEPKTTNVGEGIAYLQQKLKVASQK